MFFASVFHLWTDALVLYTPIEHNIFLQSSVTLYPIFILNLHLQPERNNIYPNFTFLCSYTIILEIL